MSGTPVSTASSAAPSLAERRKAGKAMRRRVPLEAQGEWAPAPDRPDPVALLVEQCKTRLQHLVPIRFGRMLDTPFGFYRGSPIVMAADLATTPTTGMKVQLCGDAHLSNFGVFASPERHLLFDVNDFDETIPGPFEWDVKRLAASFVVAARDNGFSERHTREAAQTAATAYREAMRSFATMRTLDMWYTRAEVEHLLSLLRGTRRVKMERWVGKVWHHDSLHALPKLTEVHSDERRIAEAPPLLTHETIEQVDTLRDMFHVYRRTLESDRRALLERYRFIDAARKVVGVGSVGTRCFVVLLDGGSGEDPLFLQIKEAEASVLSPYVAKSKYRSHSERVVAGQLLMQAASDIFLGWSRSKLSGRDYYWRQLRDMKGSVDARTLVPQGMALYAQTCGWTLARAHARSGDAAEIAGYLGATGTFDEAIATFAVAYADQMMRDHAELAKAVKAGKVKAITGV